MNRLHTISATVIQLASRISSTDVNLCEVANAGNLDIVFRLHEVDALQCSVRNGTRSTSGLGAECNCFLLDVTNDAVGVG